MLFYPKKRVSTYFIQNRGYQKSCNHTQQQQQAQSFLKKLILFKKINKTIEVGSSHSGNFEFISNYLGWVRGRKKSPKSVQCLELVVLTAIYPWQEFLKWHLKIRIWEWIPGKVFNPESRRFLHNTGKIHFWCGSISLSWSCCNRHSLISFLAKQRPMWFPNSYFSSSSSFQP